MTKVSIVLPVYNGEKYLRESIESIIEQTYSNWELIIIDDCSTDRSYEIASEYAKNDNRVLIYKNAENFKLPRSLNEGFKHASGEYFTWTSDDNMYDKDAIYMMASFLDEHKEYGLIRTNMRAILESGEIIGETNRRSCTRKDLLSGNAMGACFMYRKRVATELGGYDTNLFLVEDYDFWLRASRNNKIYAMEAVLYSYREHEKSLTNTRKNEVTRMTYDLLRRELQYVNDIDERSTIYRNLVRIAYESGNRTELRLNLKALKKMSLVEYRKAEKKHRLSLVFSIRVVKLLRKLVGVVCKK